MIHKRPFLCRIGLHRWKVIERYVSRCVRAGCHRARIQVGEDHIEWDQVLCSCGIEIVHVRENFWRNVNTGEVCNSNHWHEPAR